MHLTAVVAPGAIKLRGSDSLPVAIVVTAGTAHTVVIESAGKISGNTYEIRISLHTDGAVDTPSGILTVSAGNTLRIN